MASKSVNIHSQDYVFPGHLNNYYWQFPTINVNKRKQVNSKFTTWTIYVGIMETNVNADILKLFANKMAKNKANPDYIENYGFENFAIKLQDEYFNHKEINIAGKELCGFTVVDSHHDGSNVSFGAITVIKAGKNLAKKNATNIFTQAMRDALSKYQKKLCDETTLDSQIILPMLATGEGIPKDDITDYIANIIVKEKKVLCQYKYDGIRMMAKIAAENDPLSSIKYSNDLICYSRKGKKINISVLLQNQILDLLAKLDSGTILDGELYIHGCHLNDISGYVRSEDDSEEKQLLDYYVFDLYNDLRCFERIKLLDQFKNDYSKIKVVETFTCNSVDEILTHYTTAIDLNYEGLILRKYYALYEPSDNGYHSKNMIKVKPLFRDEFMCVGYKIGVGKAVNELVLICRLSKQNIVHAKKYLNAKKINFDNTIIREKNFNVKFKHMNVSEQKDLIAEFCLIDNNDRTRFENKYKNTFVTIEFQDYSKICMPLRPNAINFRIDL